MIPVQPLVIYNSTSKRAKNVRLSEMVIRHHPLWQLGLRATGEITRIPRLSRMNLSISTVSGLSPTTSADQKRVKTSIKRLQSVLNNKRVTSPESAQAPRARRHEYCLILLDLIRDSVGG